MSEPDPEDTGGNTEMFRAFVDRRPEPAPPKAEEDIPAFGGAGSGRRSTKARNISVFPPVSSGSGSLIVGEPNESSPLPRASGWT